MNKKILFAGWIFIASFVWACKNNENKSDAAVVDSTAAAGDSSQVTVYSCPMDTDVSSDQPGQCPKCGMDLEIKNR